jgi:hypothetical protein
VARSRNAIAYIWADALIDGVVPVKVDGKAPSDKGYPLKVKR